MKTPDLAILNTREGRLRLLSTVILAPMVIAVTILGGASFAGLILLVSATGLFEWLRLVDPDAPLPDCYAQYAALALALILAGAGLPGLGCFVIAAAGVTIYVHRSNIDPTNALWFALGLPYMAGSGLAIIYLRALPSIGLPLTLYLIAAVWGMDIGAYITGRLVGGPKLAPTISPNKTWSGFWGGIVLGTTLSCVVLLTEHATHFFRGLFIAMILGAVAQGGDLFKSFFKRRAGVKDCGTLIPGHGGILDRIDGLVFAAMILALFHMLFGNSLLW